MNLDGLVIYVNLLTAILTLISLIGYAVFYTMYLKRATPQNIVIGGAAGAAPPVLGWTSIAGSQGIEYALLLFLIVFIWTPPHFWALAIHRREEYKKAEIPMLPVTHGLEFTRVQILLYTVLLFLVALLPYLTGMSGLIYLVSAATLGALFLGYSIKIFIEPENPKIAFTRSKKVKAGFWCVACALDKHVITDKQVIRFLKKKQAAPRFRNQKKEPFRY